MISCHDRESDCVPHSLVECRVGPVSVDSRLVFVGHKIFNVAHLVVDRAKILNVYHSAHLDSDKKNFYIAKLGYAGVYIFFLFLLQNIDCGCSLEPPRRGSSNVYPQSMF